MGNDKISVIIPSYEPKDYIYECLDSLYDQDISSEKFEILVVLNGQYTPYYQNLSKYVAGKTEKIHIKILYTEIPGVSNARNIGIQNSFGKAICFIDDDDLVSKSYIRELYELHQEGTIVVSNVKTFYSTKEYTGEDYIGRAFRNLKSRPFKIFLHRKFLSSACCKLIPTKMIGNTTFSIRRKIGEDSLFMAEISKEIKNITFTSEDAIYYIRQRQGSASRRNRFFLQKVKERGLLIFDFLFLYIDGFPKYNTKFIISRIVASFIQIFK